MADDASSSWPLEQREFRRLIGEPLEAVEFVTDYFRLQFGALRVTVLNLPTLRAGGRQLPAGSAGFRDTLCGLIGKRVVEFQLDPRRQVDLTFDGGDVLSIPLSESEREGMEAVLLSEDAVVRVVLHSQ